MAVTLSGLALFALTYLLGCATYDAIQKVRRINRIQVP